VLHDCVSFPYCRCIKQVGDELYISVQTFHLILLLCVSACLDQHILIGADEGIYTLNLNELHESSMELVSPCVCVFVWSNLYAHSLLKG